MDQGLKERLVGAAVLIAVAVWLIPWVLDGPEAPLATNGSSLQLPAAEEPMPMRTEILPLGNAEEPRVEPPSRGVPEPRAATETAAADPPATSDPEPRADAGATSGETTVAATRTEPERVAPPAAQPTPAAAVAPPKPAPAAAGGDWIVQLGSFGEEANARRVAQRAGTFGYKADVSSVKRGGQTLYRVRVGPQKTRAEADSAASALRAHGINDARVVAAR
jgi:DedD protein